MYSRLSFTALGLPGRFTINVLSPQYAGSPGQHRPRSNGKTVRPHSLRNSRAHFCLHRQSSLRRYIGGGKSCPSRSQNKVHLPSIRQTDQLIFQGLHPVRQEQRFFYLISCFLQHFSHQGTATYPLALRGCLYLNSVITAARRRRIFLGEAKVSFHLPPAPFRLSAPGQIHPPVA